MADSLSTPSLHYQATGSGPLVVLLPGLLMDGESWVKNGMVATLAENYRVVSVDLAGHGKSRAVKGREAFTLEAQMLSVLNVLDKEGYETAYFVGYSAGAWIINGLLQQFNDRVDKAVLGGWDSEKGLPEGPNGPLTFDIFMDFARATAPDLAACVTPENETSLSYFFQELGKPQGLTARKYKTPLLLWAGREDGIYPAVKAIAEKNYAEFLSSDGDHVSAFQSPSKELLQRIAAFLAKESRGI